MTDDIHNEIRRKLADGTITDSTKEQLEKYVAALCRGGANNSYGSSFHAICGTVQTLLKSKISEEGEVARHLEIKNKLEELNKPHWTVNPNFWFTFIAALSGVVGCILTWGSSKQQLVEAKKSNDLNKMAAYSNASSSKANLEMTQEGLKTTKDTLKRVTENVDILKETQRANLVLISQSAGITDRRYNVTVKRQSDTLMTSLPNSVNYYFKNIGNAPIKHINIKYACIGYNDELSNNVKCPQAVVEIEQNEQGIIGPGDRVSVELKLKNDIDDVYATYQLLDAGKVHLLSRISIEYLDHLSKRELSFCKVLQNNKWRDCGAIKH